MGANLTYTNPALRNDTINWSIWITRTLNLSGFRLDAMKHMSQSFVLEFITRLQQEFDPDFLFIGEYWKWGDSPFLAAIAKKMEGRCRLYDTQLFYNFSDYSLGKKKDLRRVLEGSLVEIDPGCAVVSSPIFSFFPHYLTFDIDSLTRPCRQW
jgi:alpha-amylase